jgi:hypothetical protein
VENLVIKTHWHKTTEGLDPVELIALESPKRIDRSQIHPFAERYTIAAQMGPRSVAKHRIGVVSAQTVDAPWPMVFETATRHPYAISPQSTGDHITCIPPIACTFEIKLELLRSINPFAGLLS